MTITQPPASSWSAATTPIEVPTEKTSSLPTPLHQDSVEIHVSSPKSSTNSIQAKENVTLPTCVPATKSATPKIGQALLAIGGATLVGAVVVSFIAAGAATAGVGAFAAWGLANTTWLAIGGVGLGGLLSAAVGIGLGVKSAVC